MARFCTNCGKEIPDGVAFCTECGIKAPEQAFVVPPVNEAPVAVTAPASIPAPTHQPAPQPVYTAPSRPAQQPYVQQPSAPAEDNKSETVGTAYYFFMQLLFAIPIVGLIVCIISALTGSNKSKKNFSKAYLIWLIIGIVFSVIGTIIMISVFGSLFELSNSLAFSEYGEFSDLLEQFNYTY